MTNRETQSASGALENSVAATPQGRSGRQYVIYCCLIALLMFAAKLIIAADVPATAMFSDDYSYLNKSIYYVRGDWGMKGYIFQNIFAGILYPYAISPWLLIDGGPLPRIFFVFSVNAFLSAVTVVFGSLAIRKATGVESRLAPICLALFAPMFLLSFVVLTENMVFPLLAICAWLIADIGKIIESRRRFISLLLVVATLPLVRAPALAAGIAVALTFFCLGRRYGWKRVLIYAGLIFAATVGPYLVVMLLAPTVSKSSDAKRELRYVKAIGDIFITPNYWIALFKIAFSQLAYVTIATAGWGVALFAAFWLPRKRNRVIDPAAVRMTSIQLFALFSTFGFLGFACLHIGRKIKFDVDQAGFIFGRYDDPFALMLLIGGISSLLMFRRNGIGKLGKLLICVGAPVALLFAVAHVAEPVRWATFNQTGLAAFCQNPPYSLVAILAGVVGVSLLLQADLRNVWTSRTLMVLLIAWSVFSIRKGFDEYVFPRSERIAISQEAATWLHENTPTDVRIGFDRKEFKRESPTWGFMGLHYQALVFGIYPRDFGFARDDQGLQEYDYLFTSKIRDPAPELPVAWENKHYVLYKVIEGAQVYSPIVPKPLRTPASRDLMEEEARQAEAETAAGKPPLTEEEVTDLRGIAQSCCPRSIDLSQCKVEPWEVWQGNGRLTMAFPQSTVTLPVFVLKPGIYRLTINAIADGCDTDLPRLTVGFDEKQAVEYEIEVGRHKCYLLDFEGSDQVAQRLKLVFANDGLCDESGAQIDKNIFIDSMTIEPIEINQTKTLRPIAP